MWIKFQIPIIQERKSTAIKTTNNLETSNTSEQQTL